jgi:hypothetical protein
VNLLTRFGKLDMALPPKRGGPFLAPTISDFGAFGARASAGTKTTLLVRLAMRTWKPHCHYSRTYAKGSFSAAVTAVFLLGVCGVAAALRAAEPEGDFLNANMLAMERMMKGMALKPSGDVDVDFVNMMEPHHQGAIDMAQLELRYGRNEQLRRIAQEIIVDQQQEIAAMRLALRRELPPPNPAPDQPDSQGATRMPAMTEHNR